MNNSYENATAIKMAYANWIGEMEWNYFVSIRLPYKLSRNSIRTIFSKIEKVKNNSINFPRKVFIVSEQDADPTNHHLHLLLDCDDDCQRDEFLCKVFRKKHIKYAEEVDDAKSAGIYLTKMFHRDDTEYNFY